MFGVLFLVDLLLWLVGGLPPAVTGSGREFEVEGNDSFVTLSAALQRSCSVQHNTCADAVS